MDAKEIGVGIVGCGDGGVSNLRSLLSRKEHEIGVGVVGLEEGEGLANVSAFSQNPAVKVVALCDVNDERRAVTQKLVPEAIAYTNVDQLTRDHRVDLVVVATPDHAHLYATQYALHAGKHVLLEKPVATSLDDLKEFRRLIKQFPGKLHFSEKYSFAYPVEAALRWRTELGQFMAGTTLYTMWKCDRIMGPDGWRVHTRYNPVAGGLSHNFMTALLFTGSRIERVRATGRVFTYHELKKYGGFDMMEGTLEFENGTLLSWMVCLAIRGTGSPFVHRTVAHYFQFSSGTLIYGPYSTADYISLDGFPVMFQPEPEAKDWAEYNIHVLYRKMHDDVLRVIAGNHTPRHTIEQGINVAAACACALESAHQDGAWLKVPF